MKNSSDAQTPRIKVKFKPGRRCRIKVWLGQRVRYRVRYW